jgi:hypothetical protein
MKKIAMAILMVASVALIGGNAAAENSGVRLEAHGGIGLPTFDIADAAKIGALGGIGLWYSPPDAKWTIGAEADLGFHGGEDVTDALGNTEAGPDVNVYHLMGKAGYFVYSSADGKTNIVLNAGAGAVMFDVDAEGFDMETYLAINAGGKLYYALSPKVDFVVSLQGDISFTDKEVLGTDNAWVWPLSVGFAIKL